LGDGLHTDKASVREFFNAVAIVVAIMLLGASAHAFFANHGMMSGGKPVPPSPPPGGGALPGSILPAAPAGQSWTVAFHDEFDGSPGSSGVAGGTGGSDTINRNNFNVLPDNQPLGFACNVRNSTITISGGLLNMPQAPDLAAGCAPNSFGPYAGSYIGTNNQYGPGYYEARVKMDLSSNSFGAFWMTDGWGNTVADAFESDIFENHACQTVVNTIIYAPGGNRTQDGFELTTAGLTWQCSTGGPFDVFGFWYQLNGDLIFYLNGTETHRHTGPTDNKTDYAIVLDNSGDAPGGAQGGTSNNTPMQVDWVRYYKGP
jgi:beta-glucanase (GH16 family)